MGVREGGKKGREETEGMKVKGRRRDGMKESLKMNVVKKEVAGERGQGRGRGAAWKGSAGKLSM